MGRLALPGTGLKVEGQMKHQSLLTGFLLAGCLCAGAAEWELNLARNPEFRPGLDKQGPAGWIYYGGATGIVNAGRGYVEFFTNGMTVAGPASLHQFDMWDDMTPQYKFSCRLKSVWISSSADTATPCWKRPSASMIS